MVSWLAPQGLRRVLPLITFILGAIIILSTLNEGQRRGLDYHYLSAVDSEQSAIAIAISDLVHGLNAGYLGYSNIKQKLVEAWPPGENGARKDNVDHEAIKARQNAAIQAAAAVEPPKRAYLSDRSMMSMVFDDMGYVDLVKLSFRLFGMKMEAMHYTYFVLLSVSAVAFLIAFRADVVAQTFLLGILFAYYIEIHLGHFKYMPTFTNIRHGSTLCLIPLWHLAFLVVRRRPISIFRRRFPSLAMSLPWTDWRSAILLAATAVQLPILFLAIKLRGSAIFAVLFIVALAVVLAIAPLWKQRLRTWPIASLMRNTAQWPVVMLLGGLIVNNQIVNASLHPIYFTDDVIPYHGLWHSAILGLVYSPNVLPKRTAEAFAENKFDAGAYYAVVEYLERTHFIDPPADLVTQNIPSYTSPFTGSLKWRLHDNIARRAFWEIVADHPLEMIPLYFYKKPRAVIEQTIFQISLAPNLLWLALIAMGGAVVACFWWLTGSRSMSLLEPVALAAAPLPFSVLPNIWAYAGFMAMSDYFLLLILLAQVGVSALIILCVRQLRVRRPLLPH